MKTTVFPLTYTLGRSLYVPLTSRCNSRTLPETRGPNFLLPSHVVATLCRFRDIETHSQQWHPWCNYLDTTEYPQKLPPPLEKVASLSTTTSITTANTLLPLVADLKHAIDMEFNPQLHDCIVMAGEGEPTLRWDTLLDLTKECSSMSNIRLITNGLLLPVVEPGVPVHHQVADLLSHGLHAVSVALMTHDSEQYKEFMDPLLPQIHSGTSTIEPFTVVCDFIQAAISHGLDVEVTAVDRREVNQGKTEAKARELGVLAPVRWRPYFP